MKYRDHTDILPLLEGVGQAWAHVSDGANRRELRTTLAFGFAETNGASALLYWLVHDHNEGRSLIALLNEATRDIDEDGCRLTVLAELLARSGGGGWSASDLTTVTVAAGVVGCLIYVLMFLSSLQMIELVPAFAAGSATGLRGLLSYLLGSASGTALFGILAERYGWSAGFYLLLFAVVGCIFCCFMTTLASSVWNGKNCRGPRRQTEWLTAT